MIYATDRWHRTVAGESLSSEAHHGECIEVFDRHVPAQTGHWRAAIIPNVRIGECIGGERVRSVVTPDDFASEAEAQLAT